MEPNYTPQLEQIVAALNRPITRTWVVSLSSFTAGVVTSALGHLIQRNVSDWHEQRKMRRILYLEIAEMFMAADSIMEPLYICFPLEYEWRETRFKRAFRFDGETYCEAHRDVFFTLSERFNIREMYRSFHSIIDEPSLQAENARGVRCMLACYVKEGYLPEKYFRRYLRREEYENFMKLIEYYYDIFLKLPRYNAPDDTE